MPNASAMGSFKIEAQIAKSLSTLADAGSSLTTRLVFSAGNALKPAGWRPNRKVSI
jgi:hypothetical protein